MVYSWLKLKWFSKKEVVVPVENYATILNMESLPLFLSQGPKVLVPLIIVTAI